MELPKALSDALKNPTGAPTGPGGGGGWFGAESEGGLFAGVADLAGNLLLGAAGLGLVVLGVRRVLSG